jgi:hypothetical protein
MIFKPITICGSSNEPIFRKNNEAKSVTNDVLDLEGMGCGGKFGQIQLFKRLKDDVVVGITVAEVFNNKNPEGQKVYQIKYDSVKKTHHWVRRLGVVMTHYDHIVLVKLDPSAIAALDL